VQRAAVSADRAGGANFDDRGGSEEMTRRNNASEQLASVTSAALAARTSRRGFLRAAGVGGAVLGLPSVLARCSDSTMAPRTTVSGAVTIDLTTDSGVLNYAYALEQLEASFYATALNNPASDYTAEQVLALGGINCHEIVHRAFLLAALGDEAIPSLEFDFSSAVDFGSVSSVLALAKTLEDTGVGAYNGAGQLLTNPDFLVLAGKIVSVEARHAAIIRLLIDPKSASFGGDDVVDSNGLDQALDPSTVLDAVKPFIVDFDSITIVA
jgi:hypothetical protein